MAVYNTDNISYDNGMGLTETSLLVLKDGTVVDSNNPLPVTIQDGGGSITVDGNVTATITGTPTFTTEPFNLRVAKGNVTGHGHVHRSGFNQDIDKSTDPESIWSAGGLYPWTALNTARQLVCASSSGLDSGPLTIVGLNSSYDVISETITMNGTSNVTTTNYFLRINEAYYGGIGINSGTITMRANSVIVSQIEPQFCNELSMHYTVPNNKTAYLNRLTLSLQQGKLGARIVIYVREFGGNFRVHHVYEITEGSSYFEWPIPERLPEKTDIDIVIYETYENDTKISGCIDYLLVDD